MTFKRGDKAIYLNDNLHSMKVEEVEITATNGDMVFAKWTSEHGGIWKYRFGREYKYDRNKGETKPLWKRMPHPGDAEVKTMNKRLAKVSKEYIKYRDQVTEINRAVENEARQWQREEETRRLILLKGGPSTVDRAIRRLGFRKPKLI